MSAPGTPPPTPFVRGTSNTAQVFLLAASTRRLIPDAQTLGFLLAGQAVRVLSDADLAAIPLGAPLPSRKDGLLLTQHFAAPPPGITVYFMANGQRRRILDIETQVGIMNAGSAIIPVELADLSAIPEGPPLPTRTDGTLYGGVGTTFAYVIQGGKKRAFPNATTMSDAGFAFNNLLPITAADLGFIPDGAAFPSTSKFLAAPAAEVPLVMLPVRLETRLQNQNTELWLRVYPDDIHVNSFDPTLTPEEQSARTGFLALANDAQTRSVAFAALARQFGAARAAWITSGGPSQGVKPANSNVAPYLPERWIVLGYQGDPPGQVLAVGPVIQDPLALVPAANGSGVVTDDGTQWIRNFDRAVQAGMAFRITLTPVQQRGFTRIVVLGLKTNVTPTDSAARLSELLQAHHYTDGLELLAHNTPTNNTEDVSSGLATKDPDYAKLFALEQGPALCPARPTADGDRLARALNVPPQVLAHVNGADGAQDEQARAMNTVLWPATWGYYLSQIITGVTPAPDTILPAARDHFADHVRARGHFPALRIGRQPYGILPVCSSPDWQPMEGRALDAPLNGVLAQLRIIWGRLAAQVPRLPQAPDIDAAVVQPDPEAALVELLSMTPASSSVNARGVIGPEYNYAFWSFLPAELNVLTPGLWADLAQRTLVDNSALASAMAGTRLASATYVLSSRPLSDVVVADPLDGASAPDFIKTLAGLGWSDIVNATPPSTPAPLLFLLLRHAALREYMDTALDLLTAAKTVQASERLEPEMVNFTGIDLRPSAWGLLGTNLGTSGPVGVLLDKSRSDAAFPSFVAFWQAFNQLKQYSAADLDAATREVLDLASYRLDSWITSLAHFRLEQTRAANPAGGVVLGAYGWIENLRPQPAPPSAGYVHAPSLNQSTTAAVLRSGYLTHQGGPQKPFEIDLSSKRVRLALHLLDGIREGQSLGALLGYRMERTLHETSLDALIDNVRTAFPMDAGSELDVVDGLALLRKYNSTPQTTPTFWQMVAISQTSAQGVGLTAAVTTLNDALDSLADLTLAESVHQLARGNVLRAGATLDSIARGDTPPPEIDFVQTPRSGTALTYRFMTVAIGNSAPGWTQTPRALAEPRLNAWAAALLGDPSLVRIRSRFVAADGSTLANVEIGLDQLALAPLDLLSYAETQGAGGELAARIQREVAKVRPATVPAGAPIEVVAERDAAWTQRTIGLTEWLGVLQAVARTIGGARPMEPGDLVFPGNTPGETDTSELQLRAAAAEAALNAAITALKNSDAQDGALLGAAAFGLPNSVPSLDVSQWPVQVALALTDLSARANALAQVGDDSVSRLKAVFGSSFVVLPALEAKLSATWPKRWEGSAPLQGGDTLASVRWMQKAARVRQGIARLDTAVTYAEALASRPLLQLQVTQMPASADPADRWIALDNSAASPSSRLSLVAFSPMPYTSGAAIAGLMVDEWIEIWPSPDQITGVSFQYSDPVARAPQSLLLAVRPNTFPEWTLATVEGSVLEALNLSKTRGVDPDVLLGTIPPRQIGQNVKTFQALSEQEIFVLDPSGNLWLKHAPFDAPTPVQEQVDANVSAFQALSATEVIVLGTDGRLWLERGPFGTVPPARQQIDGGQPTLPIPVIVVPPKTAIVPALEVPLNDTDKMPLAQAEKLLQAAGLSGIFTPQPYPKNAVVASQLPAAGTVLPIGATVTVHLAPGPAVTR